MKLPLLLLTFFVSLTVFSQSTKPTVIELRPGTRFFIPNKPWVMPLHDTLKLKTMTALLDLKKPGTYRSAIDNMPVIVPDTKELVPIPNLWKGEIKVPFVPARPQMPNPIHSYSYKPNTTK